MQTYSAVIPTVSVVEPQLKHLLIVVAAPED